MSSITTLKGNCQLCNCLNFRFNWSRLKNVLKSVLDLDHASGSVLTNSPRSACSSATAIPLTQAANPALVAASDAREEQVSAKNLHL